VATTINGSGSGRETPSIVICSSAIASKSADCVFGVALSQIVFVKQQQGGLGSSEILIVNSDGTNQRLLTTVEFLRSAPSISKDGSKIIFTQNVNGSENIYVINTDGTNLTPVTNYQSKTLTSPNWSFDGSKITFASNIDNANTSLDIYTMNANGTGVTRLTNNSLEDSAPFWSPDGSKIVYTHIEGNLSGLYVMNANGSGVTRITNGFDRNPEWSPNCAKIVFDRVDGFERIFTVNPDGSGLMALTPGASTDKQPTWSPDSSKIAWSTRNNNPGNSLQIYRMNADGSGRTRLTNNDLFDDTHPSWGGN